MAVTEQGSAHSAGTHFGAKTASAATTARGTYILLLAMATPTRLSIGRLGAFDFPAGWYTYVGSAFGPGGLSGRLRHHCSPVRKPHWHIDYLRQAAAVPEIWHSAGAARCEHEWAGLLRLMPGAAVPAARFGASDCRCESHLLHFPQRPAFEAFCQRAAQKVARRIVGA